MAEITNRLNEKVLPRDHYAQVEQIAGEMVADILTLHAEPRDEAGDLAEEGGVAVEIAPPLVRITDTIEESLNIAMKSLVTGGITKRSAWGRITCRNVCQCDIPSASAASVCPRGMDWMPAR